jgi:hypothetical protein
MRTSLILAVMASIALLHVGCGTVCNLAGGVVHSESEPRIYGGVIRDMETIDKVASEASGHQLIGEGEGKGAMVILAAAVSIAAVDPMLCLVADTLTLPLTIPLQERRIAQEQASAAESSESPARQATGDAH